MLQSVPPSTITDMHCFENNAVGCICCCLVGRITMGLYSDDVPKTAEVNTAMQYSTMQCMAIQYNAAACWAHSLWRIFTPFMMYSVISNHSAGSNLQGPVARTGLPAQCLAINDINSTNGIFNGSCCWHWQPQAWPLSANALVCQC